MKISYENLDEWRRLKRLRWQDLAEVAKISPASVSCYIKAGKAFSGDVLLRWIETYDWSYEQMCYLCLNGPMPQQTEVKQYIAIDLDDLRNLVFRAGRDSV